MSAETWLPPADAGADTGSILPLSARGPFNIYRGWYNVAVALLANMLAAGSTIYSFGLFIKPAAQDLSLSRAQTSLGLILLTLGMTVANPVMGRILDRAPMKRVVRLSALLYFLGMVGISLAPSPLLIALCIFGPLAFGTAGCGGIFGIVLVSRWFSDKRGRAMSITFLGTSLGGMIVFPFIAFLLSVMSWRMALVGTGMLVGTVTMLLTLLMAPDPDAATAAHLARSGPATPTTTPTPTPTTLKPREILRERDFWIITIPVALIIGVDQALLTTITPYALDRGMGLAGAAGLMTAITTSALFAKILMAWIVDRTDIRILLGITAGFGMLFSSSLMLNPSYPIMLALSLLTGVAIGGASPLGNVLMTYRFGAASAGTSTGLMYPVIGGMGMIGIYCVGSIHDHFGSYSIAFAAFAALCLLSLFLLPLIHYRERP